MWRRLYTTTVCLCVFITWLWKGGRTACVYLMCLKEVVGGEGDRWIFFAPPVGAWSNGEVEQKGLLGKIMHRNVYKYILYYNNNIQRMISYAYRRNRCSYCQRRRQ